MLNATFSVIFKHCGVVAMGIEKLSGNPHIYPFELLKRDFELDYWIICNFLFLSREI